MKNVFLLSFVLLSSCATNPKIQAIYDQRLTNPSDKAAVQEQMKVFISDLSSAGAMPLAGAAYGVKKIEIVQKYYCVCQKTLAQKCKEPAQDLSAEKKDIWIKSNAAEASLLATGNESYIDPVLCM